MRGWIKSLDRVLKGEATRPEALRGGSIDLPIGGLTIVLIILGMLYGAAMGAFALMTRWGTPTQHDGLLQIAASAVKVPLLFLLTLLVTFPSLYVFNALVGSRLSLLAVLRLILASMAVTLAVLASFATIVLFFSLCTSSYPFMVLLNVALFALAGVMGMGFLLQTLNRLSAPTAGSVPLVAPLPEAAYAAGSPPDAPPGVGDKLSELFDWKPSRPRSRG